MRSPYRGALQILRLNWPWYVAAGVANFALVPFLLFVRLPAAFLAVAVSGLALADLWLIASLVVSHLVYDRSAIADGGWIPTTLRGAPAEIATFHAGLDETSPILESRFPEAKISTFDFHDPAAMGEPAIERARRLQPAAARSTPVHFSRVRAGDGVFDAAFVVFAAHELRAHGDRVVFLREIRRVLKRDGCLFVVEHLRDGWNFAVFGPGAFHFFSRLDWLRSFDEGGFRVEAESRVTPFVRVFRLR